MYMYHTYILVHTYVQVTIKHHFSVTTCQCHRNPCFSAQRGGQRVFILDSALYVCMFCMYVHVRVQVLDVYMYVCLCMYICTINTYICTE